jgi:putative transposase
LQRLDKSFKASSGAARLARSWDFPAGIRSLSAAEFRFGDGLTLRKSGRVGIVGIPGEIKCERRRALPSDPASAILTRQNGKWYVVFHVEVAEA